MPDPSRQSAVHHHIARVLWFVLCIYNTVQYTDIHIVLIENWPSAASCLIWPEENGSVVVICTMMTACNAYCTACKSCSVSSVYSSTVIPMYAMLESPCRKLSLASFAGAEMEGARLLEPRGRYGEGLQLAPPPPTKLGKKNTIVSPSDGDFVIGPCRLQRPGTTAGNRQQ